MNKNSDMQLANMTQTCNNSMLNNTNILYLFNPNLLTNVFAADLRWSNSTILISKNYSNICVCFFIAEVYWTFLFCVLLYRCEFTFPSAWSFISLLVWKGSYVCQK